MKFRQIRYALAVLRHRSFTEASQNLHVSQSAVSEQVKLLEDYVGFALFRRTAHGVEPTERGRLFFYEAERVANEFRNLSDYAWSLRGTAQDKISLGIVSGLSAIILPRLLPEPSAFPDAQIEIQTAPTSSILDQLHQEKLNIGIAVRVDPDRIPTGISTLRLAELGLIVIAPPDHRLAASGRPLSLADLNGEPFIMNELSVGYGRIISDLLADHGVRPDVKAIIDNIETMKEFVRLNMGVAIIPEAGADAERKEGTLTVLPMDIDHRIKIDAYFPRHRLSQKQSDFLNAMVARFNTEAQI